MQKRSLIELKKKYNFYEDDSSSSSASEKAEEEEVPRESESSGEKEHRDAEEEEDPESSLVTPVRDDVKIRMQAQPPQRTADSRIDSLSQFLKDEPLGNGRDDEDDDEGSIADYSKLEESKDEGGMFEEIEGKLDRILSKHSELLNHQRDAEDQLFEKAEDSLSEMELYQLSDAGGDGLSSIENRLSSVKKGLKLRGSIIEDQRVGELVVDSSKRDPAKAAHDLKASYQSHYISTDRPQTELTFGDLTSNGSEQTFSELKDSNLILSQAYKRKPGQPLVKQVIKEEINEEESTHSLEYSQATMA